jgi:hypothetical protein
MRLQGMLKDGIFAARVGVAFRVALGAGLLLLSMPGAAHADGKVSENASRRFAQGVRYLTSQDPGRYEKAYREFKAAYADSPSWKILGNLGIVAHELERDGEAIEAFEAYLERGGKELPADDRKQFKEDLALVKAGHSTVAIETQPGGAWIIDERLPETGEPIVNRYGPTEGKIELRIRAGHHRIRAELNGFDSDVWEFSDAPGAISSHTFDLAPERAARQEEPMPVEGKRDVRADSKPGGSSGLRAASYVALGLGVVGAGVGTYFAIDGYDKRTQADDLFAACEAQNPGCGTAASGYDKAIAAQDAEGQAFTRSLVSYVAGGVFAATGVVLFIVSSGNDESPDAAGEASLTPWLSPNGVGVSGTF